MVDNKVINIHRQWYPILGEEIPLIEPYHYVKLSKIFPPPKLPATRKYETVIEVLPYIRQKVKMWGADVLRAENIKTLIEEEDDVSVSDEEFSDVESMDEDQDFRQNKNKLSRFDCIASLLASSECTVAQDIFRTLSQFPIAFPLVIPGLVDADTFKVMLPLLIGPVIKWETKPGTIIENHLFSDPFKMIVAVRIGANSPGKSTILNQLMTSDSMFSSSCEPRAEHGIPHMVSGSVEFTWLTQETCGVGLWNDVFENYYKEGAKEIVLLANLHGDAMDYPNQIRLLKQFPSSFLVFLMPGYTDDQVDHFENIVGFNKVVYCWVNHKKKKYAIDTKLLMKDQTLKKVRLMFKEALDFTSSFNANRLKLRDTLHFAEGIELPESQLLIKFVEEKTCRHIKLKVMQLQRKQSYNGLQIWQDNVDLQGLIFLYIDILNLPLGKRMRALAHLEREVSRLSMIESSEARNKAVLKREELRKSSLVNRNQESEESIRREIAKIWAEVDNMSLGMEHFFRELGRIYSIFSVHYQWHDIVVKVPKLYAELLISGHTIELLDGDAGDISEAWFSAICNCICKKFPKLRIFVISILGLQSSGKSTLLNALFACRFAVSVGRCTRGLFMRLLFLEKNLSDQLGVDAFVLIDTEGLGAPEKMDDPESEKKDRILATFAMGVSNLTILNVLGESTRDLTEILQIAIVTMARLEKAEMAPDILMVQHVSERNVAKLSEPEEKFRIALQEALKVAEEQDIEMGIFNTKCLHILDERIKKGQLLKQFRPFKNGATAYAPPSEQYHEDVVNLYESILADCKNSRRKIEFSEWNSLIQGYWRAVSLENFAVHFKNIKEIYEFIDLGKRITKVKEAISRAFLKHEEKIMQKIRSKLQNWSPDDRANENLRIRNECLKLIESGLEDVLNCDNNSNCEECKKANKERVELEEYLKEKDNEKSETETKQTIENYIKLNRQSVSDKLTRMLSAIIIRKGLSSESLEIINRHLEDIIRNMPSRGFPDHERKRKIEEIWNALRSNILSKDKPIPVERLIDDEVEYYYNLLPNDLHNKYKNGIYPKLSNCKAYKFLSRKIFSQYLEEKDVHDLQGKLDNLADLIFKDRTSQHFYPGIVNDLKKVIDMTLSNFQRIRSNFESDFKWNVHLYALLKFKPNMKKFQDDWEKENSPLGILDQKKEEYLKIIDTRLQYGHSLVSEGHIVGDYLLRVIHKKAMKAGNSERVRAVSDIAWMTNSETVRLKYFEELAEQVQKGDKAAAIRHFSIPEYSIKDWFIRTVNSVKNGNPEQKFKETFNAEFERVLQEIRNCKNFEEIKVYVNKYMTQVDNVDYKLDLKHTLIKDGSIKLFQRTIEEELENKGNGRYSNPEPFQNPSDDKSIMKRLGCTEACHWCGALCWGSRDHHENSDSTKVHHTSHQPSGLSGTKDRYTRELRANPCNKMTDDWYVWYHGKVDATTWGDAKARDFSDWKFETHCNQIFNELMCWFFEKLHHDLAAKWDCKPSPYTEMTEYDCLNWNYDRIISTIRTKLK